MAEPNHPDRLAFLAAIAAAPGDYLRRQVYADWLDEHDEPAEADRQRAYEAAEMWLKDFAERAGETYGYGNRREDRYYPITYEDVVEAGRNFVERGEYFTQFGETTAQDLMYDDATREEFWRHWSVVTGVEVPDRRRSGRVFSCSC
jgi:uncharacterized protein (TIGR02996 family)